MIMTRKEPVNRTPQQELGIMTKRVERLEKMGKAVVANPKKAYSLLFSIVRSNVRIPKSSSKENMPAAELLGRTVEVFGKYPVAEREDTLTSLMALRRQRLQPPGGSMC